MTAQVQNRRPDGDQSGKRRKKVGAFALAGVVAAAGIAGVVVTSSAYFTDVKEISTNTVTLRGVDIETYDTGSSTPQVSFDLTELAPVTATNSVEYDAAPTRKFDVRNISTSDFKYKVEVVDIVLKQKNGTTDLPATETASALTEAQVKSAVKVNATRTAAAGTPAYVPADAKTLATLGATPLILNDTDTLATLRATSTTLTTDEGIVGVRFWIDQTVINGWTAGQQNLLQNVKISYKLKLTATQL